MKSSHEPRNSTVFSLHNHICQLEGMNQATMLKYSYCDKGCKEIVYGNVTDYYSDGLHGNLSPATYYYGTNAFIIILLFPSFLNNKKS